SMNALSHDRRPELVTTSQCWSSRPVPLELLRGPAMEMTASEKERMSPPNVVESEWRGDLLNGKSKSPRVKYSNLKPFSDRRASDRCRKDVVRGRTQHRGARPSFG